MIDGVGTKDKRRICLGSLSLVLCPNQSIKWLNILRSKGLRSIFDEVYHRFGVSHILKILSGPEVEPGGFGTCPVCGGRRFQITSNNKAWSCWTGDCHEKNGRNALGLSASVWHIRPIQAARKLLNEEYQFVTSFPTSTRILTPVVESWKLSTWQTWIEAVVDESHKLLMNPKDDLGRQTLQYLTNYRGLSIDTIKKTRIGLNRIWKKSNDAIPSQESKIAPGITIPWFCTMGFCGLNVRSYPDQISPQKYMLATGSKRNWLYPGFTLESSDLPLLITEGEFDCLIAGQALEGLCVARTLGSSTSGPDRLSWSERLSLGRFRAILIAVDADEAGRKCRDLWLNYSRHCFALDLPAGFKDLNEAYTGGFDLRDWLANEIQTKVIGAVRHQVADLPQSGGLKKS